MCPLTEALDKESKGQVRGTLNWYNMQYRVDRGFRYCDKKA